MMRRVIIESPFKGYTIKEAIRNKAYLKAAIRDSVLRGESPYASHRMLPGALNDNNEEERKLGITAGYAWWEGAYCIAFYTDLGWSRGMLAARDRALKLEMTISERNIPVWKAE